MFAFPYSPRAAVGLHMGPVKQNNCLKNHLNGLVCDDGVVGAARADEVVFEVLESSDVVISIHLFMKPRKEETFLDDQSTHSPRLVGSAVRRWFFGRFADDGQELRNAIER